ncbi:MAG TPA: heavy metal-associated domain-containing protein [Pirellulaceae bacterium]|jgi:copper chaperone CopZ|nr:heavy metal-associated domain-containing protein [Pirellulaceae bacterium]
METTRLKVTGMSCGGCAANVEKALLKVPGVVSANVALQEGQAEVQHQGGDVQAMTAALEKSGYGAQAL